ncbi:MAG TPA: PilZ domain-containing protein [Cellvibrio sp.]|nr:PilZ domain-containing protein [Cellvibrio sp.]
MRNYIRHPTSIPIHVKTGGYDIGNLQLQNLSTGGLCFMTDKSVKIGSCIDFLIPVVKPDYIGKGIVVWRHKQAPRMFEVGLKFTSDDEFFRARMVEQVCQIEKYRHDIEEQDGRKLNSEEAALEWIAKYAKGFGEEE